MNYLSKIIQETDGGSTAAKSYPLTVLTSFLVSLTPFFFFFV